MSTVASHLQGLHERAGRDSELSKEVHAGIAAHHKRIAELHRELHKSTGASDSPHAGLAIEHDGLAQRHATLAKRIGEHGEYHRGKAAEVGKSAARADLGKGQSADDLNKLVPSNVSAINRGANHLIPRTGTPVARTGTDNAVAPQLAKMMALDD